MGDCTWEGMQGYDILSCTAHMEALTTEEAQRVLTLIHAPEA